MKRIALIFFAFVLSAGAFAQSHSSVNDSLLTEISQRLDRIEYRMRSNDRYRMYKTENIYNLLKLDTATGIIEQVQWSLNEEDEGSVFINSEPLSYISESGTFVLYPTQNMYQFILLNQVTGKTWHVQWGMDNRTKIYRTFAAENIDQY